MTALRGRLGPGGLRVTAAGRGQLGWQWLLGAAELAVIGRVGDCEGVTLGIVTRGARGVLEGLGLGGCD